MGTTTQNLSSEIDQCVEELHNWCDCWMQLWIAPFKGFTAMTGESDGTYRSPQFTIAASATPCTLSVALPGLLCTFAGQTESIAANLVQLDPASLAAGQTTFRLQVAAAAVTSNRAGVYLGTVAVTPSTTSGAGTGSPSVPVWIVIP